MIKEKVLYKLYNICVEAGIKDPPTEYSVNDVEARTLQSNIS